MSVVNSLIKADASCTLFEYPAAVFTQLLMGDGSADMLEHFVSQEKDKATLLEFGVTCTDRGYTKKAGDYDYVASKWVKPDSTEVVSEKVTPTFMSLI